MIIHSINKLIPCTAQGEANVPDVFIYLLRKKPQNTQVPQARQAAGQWAFARGLL